LIFYLQATVELFVGRQRFFNFLQLYNIRYNLEKVLKTIENWIEINTALLLQRGGQVEIFPIVIGTGSLRLHFVSADRQG
jgi:hypothetical protein